MKDKCSKGNITEHRNITCKLLEIEMIMKPYLKFMVERCLRVTIFVNLDLSYGRIYKSWWMKWRDASRVLYD